MKSAVFVLVCVCLAGTMTSFADVIVYQNDYEGETAGNGFPAWNWSDNEGFHQATYEDWGGIVVQHYGGNDNTAGIEAVDARFGSKWTITPSGNTSTNPADYTISFDVMNVLGGLDPMPLEFFVLTGTGNGVGKGSGISNYSTADGWVHVEKGLDELNVGWWNGSDWVLTDTTWQIELGGPGWPGTSVAAGQLWEQMWLFDNLMITVPEPATMALMGLGVLTMLRKRN